MRSCNLLQLSRENVAVADCILILPCVQLPIYLFLYLSIYLLIYLCIYLCFHLCIFLFPFLLLSLPLSLFLSIFLSLSSCLSPCISVCLSAMLSDDREPNKIGTKVTKTKTHMLFLSALSCSPSASLTVGVIRGPT